MRKKRAQKQKRSTEERKGNKAEVHRTAETKNWKNRISEIQSFEEIEHIEQFFEQLRKA